MQRRYRVFIKNNPQTKLNFQLSCQDTKWYDRNIMSTNTSENHSDLTAIDDIKNSISFQNRIDVMLESNETSKRVKYFNHIHSISIIR